MSPANTCRLFALLALVLSFVACYNDRLLTTLGLLIGSVYLVYTAFCIDEAD